MCERYELRLVSVVLSGVCVCVCVCMYVCRTCVQEVCVCVCVSGLLSLWDFCVSYDDDDDDDDDKNVGKAVVRHKSATVSVR